MILEVVITTITLLINYIFEILPNIPNVPADVSTAISQFLNLIFDHLGLIGVFVPLHHVYILATLCIVLFTFEYSYYLILWVIKKIPFLGME